MENLAHHLYRISVITNRDGSFEYLGFDCCWNPNEEEYKGYITYDDANELKLDLRATTNEIRYAQLLFYEVYKYGRLSDWSMMTFRHFTEEKPKYSLIL